MLFIIILIIISTILIIRRIKVCEDIFIECYWKDIDKDFKDVIK